MRRIINSIILLAIMAIALPSYGQGLKAFKLKNGLSVYIWEDNTKSDVYGIVACRTGSVNDPAEYTGLAHYLEHVMFKEMCIRDRYLSFIRSNYRVSLSTFQFFYFFF